MKSSSKAKTPFQHSKLGHLIFLTNLCSDQFFMPYDEIKNNSLTSKKHPSCFFFFYVRNFYRLLLRILKILNQKRKMDQTYLRSIDGIHWYFFLVHVYIYIYRR